MFSRLIYIFFMKVNTCWWRRRMWLDGAFSSKRLFKRMNSSPSTAEKSSLKMRQTGEAKCTTSTCVLSCLISTTVCVFLSYYKLNLVYKEYFLCLQILLWMQLERGTRSALPITRLIPTATPKSWWSMVITGSVYLQRDTSIPERSSFSIIGKFLDS